MIGQRGSTKPPEVEKKEQYKLYVEGNKEEDFDPSVLSALLQKIDVKVEPLGPSFEVQAVARAMLIGHEHYFFLIDRDHYDDKVVEKSWKNFPDPAASNLLIWRKRELENYFLDPEYLKKSQDMSCSEDKLRSLILDEAGKRIFFDAANLVIVKIREDIKIKWIECFEKPGNDFNDAKKALKKLLGRSEFPEKMKSVSKALDQKYIEKLFGEILEIFLDGKSKPEYGSGKWLEMMKGKEVLPTIINKCFKIKDNSGKALQGEMKMKEIGKALVRLPLDKQPQDFIELHGMISKQLNR